MRDLNRTMRKWSVTFRSTELCVNFCISIFGIIFSLSYIYYIIYRVEGVVGSFTNGKHWRIYIDLLYTLLCLLPGPGDS